MHTPEPARHGWRRPATCLLVLLVTCSGCRSGETPPPDRGQPTAAARLIPDRSRLTAASELTEKLARSPFALFRFVNQAWTELTCEALSGEVRALPTARLHGDAHIEQYAMTATGRGLDDFDDSARGPAAIDLVRFLGSLELAAQVRGWNGDLPAVIDAFFKGYRHGLEDPAYLPPDPAVVKRLRAEPGKSREAFLAWTDSLMRPMTPAELEQLDWPRFETYAARVNPAYTPPFLRLKKLGWLRMGIGSALSRKFLARLEGPSPAVEDDVIIEVKEVSAHRAESCANAPQTGEPFRIVEGMQRLGRIRQGLLVALPTRETAEPGARGWWVRAWDPSFRELDIADLASPGELRDVALDVGAQLGSTNLGDYDASLADRTRFLEREGLARLETRIRQVAHDLTLALLDAWQQIKKG
jgi:hypothetical protein